MLRSLSIVRPTVFAPPSISGCVLNVTAKKGITQASNVISAAKDYSGHGYDMAPLNGSPTYAVAGQNGLPTVSFIGSNNDNLCRIGLGGVTRTAFSFYAVLSYSSAPASGVLYWAPSASGWTGTTNDTYIELSGGAASALDYWVSGVAAKAVSTANTFLTGQVYMLVGTYDGTTLKIYINNTLVGSQAYASSKIGDRITVGGAQPSFAGYQFTCKISEFALYDKALSTTEMTTLLAYSQRNWFPRWGGCTNSVAFDGSASRLNGGTAINFDYNSAFTMMGWVRGVSGDGTNERSIMGHQFGSGDFHGMDFLLNSTGELRLYMASVYPTNYLDVKTTVGVPRNDVTWTHCAVTHDGTGTSAGTKFYLNGVLQTNSIIANTLSASIADSGLNFFVGDAHTTTYMKGNLHQVAMFSDVLSGAEITSIYNFGCPRDISTFRAITHLWCQGNTLAAQCTDQVGSVNLTAEGGSTLSSAVPTPLLY